jgi:hypothetical protein
MTKQKVEQDVLATVSPSPLGAAALIDGKVYTTYYGGGGATAPAPDGEVRALGLDGSGPIALMSDGRLLQWSGKHGWRPKAALFPAESA